ncbi:hypothetical protein [Marinifilum sp. D714]|uniref:hypothetical protein n=1 Tax=Marinifilum sp. D714 TaxID=2937523 RepID=UPI0027BEE040|nr:hypothetical protein [Marinifilum sp. D714]MDQ2179396.1 hypothetical protein [Marinifilum sp. D714]
MKDLLKDAITNLELVTVKGGKREVEKIDHDGDGRWDEKIVKKDGKEIKRVIRPV